MAGIKEVASKIAEETGISKVASAELVSTVLQTITDLVYAGEEVIIRGFGTFKIRESKACTRRNPATGGTVEVEAKRKMVFKSRV